jgi:hypothetical protein
MVAVPLLLFLGMVSVARKSIHQSNLDHIRQVEQAEAVRLEQEAVEQETERRARLERCAPPSYLSPALDW